MIPKIIHYCWLSNDPIPENLQKCMLSWKEKLCGYEFVLWNFDRFDIHSSLWVKQAFEAKKYAFAADYIRLYAVYHYGGIYLDMDIEVIKPFDDLLNAEYMIAYENNDSKNIEAGCFGAVKEAQYIKECFEYFKDKTFTIEIIKNGYTLPRIMKGILTDDIKINIYKEDYFTAKSFATGKINVTENTYSIHHYEGSWLSKQDVKHLEKCRKIYTVLGTSIFSRTIVKLICAIKMIHDKGFFSTIKYTVKKYL